MSAITPSPRTWSRISLFDRYACSPTTRARPRNSSTMAYRSRSVFPTSSMGTNTTASTLNLKPIAQCISSTWRVMELNPIKVLTCPFLGGLPGYRHGSNSFRIRLSRMRQGRRNQNEAVGTKGIAQVQVRFVAACAQ